MFAKVSYLDFFKGLFLSESCHCSNYYTFQCCVLVLSLIYASGKLAIGCIIKRLWTQTDMSLSHRRIWNNSYRSLQHSSFLLFPQNPTPALAKIRAQAAPTSIGIINYSFEHDFMKLMDRLDFYWGWINVSLELEKNKHIFHPCPGVMCAGSRPTAKHSSRVTWPSIASGSAPPSRYTAVRATTRPIRRQTWGCTPTRTYMEAWHQARRWGRTSWIVTFFDRAIQIRFWYQKTVWYQPKANLQIGDCGSYFNTARVTLQIHYGCC